MKPPQTLPLPSSFSDDDTYVESLLCFVTTSELHRTLCGGVHILDFFTRTPDLYETLLDSEWRAWFELHGIDDILDLILRQDLIPMILNQNPKDILTSWRNRAAPPISLLMYIYKVRSLCLERQFGGQLRQSKIPPNIAIGMKKKKTHEVACFASYMDKLAAKLDDGRTRGWITDFVDFGSGQNYLGRTLASQPYCKMVIAVEGRPNNVERARLKDVAAGLAPKSGILRNKKIFRGKLVENCSRSLSPQTIQEEEFQKASISPISSESMRTCNDSFVKVVSKDVPSVIGSVRHLSTRLNDGNLSSILDEKANETSSLLNLIVMSLHSCGNLSHHGLRALILNSFVSAVAIIGCCYNLLTEYNPYPHQMSAPDPHGFPMSARLRNYALERSQTESRSPGISLPITPRMLAVQAPQNWTPAESANFFTRHFYRALLQRIFLDRGAIDPPASRPLSSHRSGHRAAGAGDSDSCRSSEASAAGGTSIIIGSLRKHHYANFVTYVRGAMAKLSSTTTSFAAGHANTVTRVLGAMQDISDAEIAEYETRYAPRKKHLSVVWALMAFSAQLIEAVIVVDRWQWLREQDEVDEAWVEAVWDYSISPRNLVVVGIKKSKR